MSEEYDYLFKSIVVGDGGVGKTALTLRFSKDFFTEDYKMTIGVDFHVKTITIDTAEGPIKAKLQLWDTGGQERFSSIRPMYYRGSLGAVLVFDLTNSSSFDHLPQWIEEVRANIKTEIPLLLVGNKSDLLDQRVVSLEEINNFTRDFNLFYMETSAKTGEGVGDCFYILACLMIGQGVPDQLITDGTVYAPGRIAIESTQASFSTPVEKPLEDLAAPPVPEPNNLYETDLEDYAAPPVPEPQINYAAPPVPEPAEKEEINPSIEPEVEPNVPVPKPDEFEFKMPEEILSVKDKESQQEKILEDTFEGEYKPKTVPFSSNAPVPAPPPEEFKAIQDQNVNIQPKSVTPFQVVKKEDTKVQSTINMTPDISNAEQQQQRANLTGSDNLSDYIPEVSLSKKERKKLEKQKKKKQKKKKLEEEKAKQEMLLEKMKQSKKKTEASTSETPSLFQTLTQKGDLEEDSIEEGFIPFISQKEKEKKQEESSTLRIIPNVEDIEDKESELSGFTAINAQSTQIEKSDQKDFLVCEQCGATLSSDYAFCNKCGNKLK